MDDFFVPSSTSFGGFSFQPSVIQFPGAATSPATTPSSNNSPAWWQTLATTGTTVLNSVLGYELQQNQINKGQVPSIGYSNVTGAPQGQSVAQQIAAQTGLSQLGTSGSWLWLVIIAVVALLVMRH